jgi:predicted AAA+ superfamily ATPase
VALETVLIQHLRAVNDYGNLGYVLHYWRTAAGDEVDAVLYGERGFHAIEVQSSTTVRDEDLRGLRRFREEYPEAKALLLHMGEREGHDRGVDIMPFGMFLARLPAIL